MSTGNKSYHFNFSSDRIFSRQGELSVSLRPRKHPMMGRILEHLWYVLKQILPRYWKSYFPIINPTSLKVFADASLRVPLFRVSLRRELSQKSLSRTMYQTMHHANGWSAGWTQISPPASGCINCKSREQWLGRSVERERERKIYIYIYILFLTYISISWIERHQKIFRCRDRSNRNPLPSAVDAFSRSKNRGNWAVFLLTEIRAVFSF